ncbi:hypothetical protein F2Q70_00002147 [Brassica cretica]|uniref:Uncharacterized protein n=1 Tax=Brassica cretica TaxID=69181 RepID=A0A8S9J090_BRACR|nr:hypothetical protein F2Q70_00002147 [Brassica cretica]
MVQQAQRKEGDLFPNKCPLSTLLAQITSKVIRKYKKKEEVPSRRLQSVSTDETLWTSIDIASPAGTDINILTSVDIHSGLEPKLTSNTKLDTTACLGAWYTWDQILQTNLEDSTKDTKVDQPVNYATLAEIV